MPSVFLGQPKQEFMSQVLLDELVSLCELLLFFARILNPFATKLSLFVFLVISWRCQSLLFGAHTFFVSSACESRNTFFQSFTDRFLLWFYFELLAEWFGQRKRSSKSEWGTHTYIEPSIHSQSVVNICFTTLFALGWNLQPFFMRQTDVAELSLEMGPELFSDGYVYLFSAAFWRGFSESYFVSHPANMWWASARLPPSPHSACLPVGRGKSNCREMHMEYYDLISLNGPTWALVNGSSAIW